MTEIVANRQSGTIDQNLIKEGDKIWVVYRDKTDTVAKRGSVVNKDDDSITLDVGKKSPIDIKYRQISTLSRPVKGGRFVSLSAGAYSTAIVFLRPQNLLNPSIGGAGFSFRSATYTNYGIEANLSLGGAPRPSGGGSAEFSKWLSTTINWYGYLVIPRTYLFVGLGYIWPVPTESYREEYFDDGERISSGYMRFGIGRTMPISKQFNIRAEFQISALIGLRVYFERRLDAEP